MHACKYETFSHGSWLVLEAVDSPDTLLVCWNFLHQPYSIEKSSYVISQCLIPGGEVKTPHYGPVLRSSNGFVYDVVEKEFQQLSQTFVLYLGHIHWEIHQLLFQKRYGLLRNFMSFHSLFFKKPLQCSSSPYLMSRDIIDIFVFKHYFWTVEHKYTMHVPCCLRSWNSKMLYVFQGKREASNLGIDGVDNMAKEIVVMPYGIFRRSKMRKKGIVEKLKRLLNRSSFWSSFSNSIILLIFLTHVSLLRVCLWVQA